MEQFLPGIVQAAVVGAFTFVAIYLVYSLKAKDEVPTASKARTKTGAAKPGAKPVAFNIVSDFDIGLVAGGYAIVFFATAIFDALFAVIKLDGNDMIGLFVVLDVLTAAAWIWGTKYKLMRGIATLFAVSVTALALFLFSRHLHA